MRETQLVARIRKLASVGPKFPSLIRAIGDDCAILRPKPGEDLVFTTDFVLEDRHFTLATHSPADIGHKALARSLSDLAAMGSRPVFCLLSLALPAKLQGKWLNDFYRGLLALASRYNIALAGGDLANFENVTADVMCCGSVPRGKALLRSGAKPGHFIYVTGSLGASAHGLRTRKGAAWKRHLRPEPRIEAGLALSDLSVSACMDISDGLSLDLHRLCLESKVGAALTSDIPVAPGATVADALHGGDDYELLFTAPPRLAIPPRIGSLPITRIGAVTRGNPGKLTFDGRPLAPSGFDHFT